MWEGEENFQGRIEISLKWMNSEENHSWCFLQEKLFQGSSISPGSILPFPHVYCSRYPYLCTMVSVSPTKVILCSLSKWEHRGHSKGLWARAETEWQSGDMDHFSAGNGQSRTFCVVQASADKEIAFISSLAFLSHPGVQRDRHPLEQVWHEKCFALY